MKKASRIKRLLKYFIFILIVIGVLIGLNLFFQSREPVTYTPPLTPVTVKKAAQGNIDKGIKISTHIEAEAMIPVVPFVSGTIEEYNIEAGQLVKKDDILAVIDKEAYYQQMLQARAGYLAYDSAYKRVKELNSLGAATDQDLDSVTAQRDAAQAQLELAKLQLSYAEVKAPVEGTILNAPQAKGDIASDRSPIAIIADLNNLIVNISVPEKYYEKIKGNEDNLRFKVTANELTSTATLISISPYIDATTKTFNVKLKIDNPTLFVPGMYAKAEIIYESKSDIPFLPQEIRKSDGSLYIVIDGVAKHITFTPEIENDSYFMVPSGYEDALFIDAGHNDVLDGEKVNIKEM